jgi:polyisoprenoid-binding protein YceI
MRCRPTCVWLSIAILAGFVGCSSQPNNERPAAKESDSRAREATGGGGKDLDYTVNPEQSRFTAQVGVGGLLAAAGHPHTIAIRGIDGGVRLDDDKLDSASLHFTIKAESLGEVGKEFDEEDRKKVNQAVHGEALEVSRYPEIVFTGKAVSVDQVGEGRYTAIIKGELSLHGVKRQVSFPVKVRRENRKLHASGAFTILHSDFNLKRLAAVGGMVKADNEIHLTFDLQMDRG